MSHSVKLLVKALAVSAPAGTLVAREKLAGELAPSPAPLWRAVQPIVTSPACQASSGDPQLIAGGVLSSWTVKVFVASTLPAMSVAKYEIVVTPSLVIFTEAEAPLTTVEAMGCAPVALKVL